MNTKLFHTIKVSNYCNDTIDLLQKPNIPTKISVEIEAFEIKGKPASYFVIRLSSIDHKLLKNLSKRIYNIAMSTGAVAKITERERIVVLKPKIKSDILVSFYKSKEKYERLAREVQRLFEIDPDFPKESVYTIKHRIKGEERLIEKIVAENAKSKPALFIDSKNYPDKINDILGIRIVCFRRSDTEKVKEYLSFLKKEQKFRFLRKPEEKLPPFLWIQNPKEKYPNLKDIQYSGYSSFHYVVKPGIALKLPKELSVLRFEIQVRNVFEEAWGELDHKYRYEIARKGVSIPDDIDRGFRSLSAYLQSASIQAEFLCKGVDKFISEMPTRKRPKRVRLPIAPIPISPTSTMLTAPEIKSISGVLQKKAGFIPTERTMAYVERRMFDSGFFTDLPKVLDESILTDESVKSFGQIYKEVMSKEPFIDSSHRDIDLLNLVNYSLFSLHRPQNVAKEDLRSVLKTRIAT